MLVSMFFFEGKMLVSMLIFDKKTKVKQPFSIIFYFIFFGSKNNIFQLCGVGLFNCVFFKNGSFTAVLW